MHSGIKGITKVVVPSFFFMIPAILFLSGFSFCPAGDEPDRRYKRLKSAHDDLVVKYNRAIQELLQLRGELQKLKEGRIETELKKSEEAKLISQNVYVFLRDPSPESRKRLVESCKKHLSSQPGIVLFTCGSPLDSKFDAGFQILFKNQAVYEKFQKSPEYLKFIHDNQKTWERIWTFATRVEIFQVGSKS